MYELMVESRFDSAHNLRGYNGPCESLHGHTYKVQVSYRGSELGKLGMLVDFKVLKGALRSIIEYLDHTYLNELPEFSEMNPTAENLARFIYERMVQSVDSGVSKVTVWETPTSSATYSSD